jgi:hypothetical protein
MVKETAVLHESFNTALPQKVTLLDWKKCVLSLQKYPRLIVEQMKENALDHMCSYFRLS